MEYGLAVSGLQGVLTLERGVAPDTGEQVAVPQVALSHGVLRISNGGLRGLFPPNVPLQGDRIEGGRVHFRVTYRGMEGSVQAVPEVSPAGRLRLEIVSARALIFPIPVSVITFLVAGLAPNAPGIVPGEGGHPEVDLAALLAPAGIQLPPLRQVRSGHGVVELEFGS